MVQNLKNKSGKRNTWLENFILQDIIKSINLLNKGVNHQMCVCVGGGGHNLLNERPKKGGMTIQALFLLTKSVSELGAMSREKLSESFLWSVGVDS